VQILARNSEARGVLITIGRSRPSCDWKSFSSERLSRTFMISDPESVATALRPMSGVKDVDIVHFPSEKELWIVLRDPVNLDRLRKASERLGYIVAKRGSWASMLPRSLAEMIWDGVMFVVAKHTHVPGKGEYSARVMRDFATGDTIYHIIDADGLEILKDYLRTRSCICDETHSKTQNVCSGDCSTPSRTPHRGS